MAIGSVRIWQRGNYVYCVKTTEGGDVQKREFKSQTKITQDEEGGDDFVIQSDDLGIGNKNISQLFKENGDPYTSEEFLQWADDNTGFNTAPGGSGAHSGLSLDDGTNPHGTTKADLNLENVDNTSDSSKPVSTAQQAALDGKANTSHNHAIGDVTGLQGGLNSKVGSVSGVLVDNTDPKNPVVNPNTYIEESTVIPGSTSGVWQTRIMGAAYANHELELKVYKDEDNFVSQMGVREFGSTFPKFFPIRRQCSHFEVKTDAFGRFEIQADNSNIIFEVTGKKPLQ